MTIRVVHEIFLATRTGHWCATSMVPWSRWIVLRNVKAKIRRIEVVEAIEMSMFALASTAPARVKLESAHPVVVGAIRAVLGYVLAIVLGRFATDVVDLQDGLAQVCVNIVSMRKEVVAFQTAWEPASLAQTIAQSNMIRCAAVTDEPTEMRVWQRLQVNPLTTRVHVLDVRLVDDEDCTVWSTRTI